MHWMIEKRWFIEVDEIKGQRTGVTRYIEFN
jgi:hypothetical protein